MKRQDYVDLSGDFSARVPDLCCQWALSFVLVWSSNLTVTVEVLAPAELLVLITTIGQDVFASPVFEAWYPLISHDSEMDSDELPASPILKPTKLPSPPYIQTTLFGHSCHSKQRIPPYLVLPTDVIAGHFNQSEWANKRRTSCTLKANKRSTKRW